MVPRQGETPARGVRTLRSAGFRPSKSLGQNFLVDPNLLLKIAEAAELSGDEHVVEIGSGFGALTERLAGRVDALHSVEIDHRLLEEQKRRLHSFENIQFVHQDFLEFDLEAAAPGKRMVVVGNIPYKATAPILGRLLDHAHLLDRAVLCLQKEVAARILASPGSRKFGRLSLAVQYRAAAEKLFLVPAEAFRPRPRVESVLIRLRFHHPPPVRARDDELLFTLAEQLFHGRRKMIRTGLRAFRGLSPEDLRAVENRSGVDLSRRPEDLDVEEWCRLSDQLGTLT